MNVGSFPLFVDHASAVIEICWCIYWAYAIRPYVYLLGSYHRITCHLVNQFLVLLGGHMGPRPTRVLGSWFWFILAPDSVQTDAMHRVSALHRKIELHDFLPAGNIHRFIAQIACADRAFIMLESTERLLNAIHQ